MELGRLAGRTPRLITDEEREAAVLVPVIERDDGCWLLFTKRAENLGEHPGQMSFPGGGREAIDADRQETALREANEEIGLDPAQAQIVGALDDIRTVTEYAVTPYVARIPDRAYVPDEREVSEVAILPVAAFFDPENYRAERRSHPAHGMVVVHYFDVDGYTVWGATGRIVVQFLELVTDWRPPDPSEDVDDALGPDADAGR